MNLVDDRIRGWFDERPELLTKFPNHWVVVNVARRGVMVSAGNESDLMMSLAKYQAAGNSVYNNEQAMDEVYIVNTSSFRGATA